MELDLTTVLLLLCTGLFVGVVNTFGGAAAVVTITLFTAMGMPATMANGTNRIPVLFQCLTMSVNFGRQKILDYRTGFLLAIPTIFGAIIGSQLASTISDSVFVMLLSTMLIVLLSFLLFKPGRIMHPQGNGVHRGIRKLDYILFLLIGLYGGCFHVGIGYFILSVVIMRMGYNLLEANALKGFIVLLYIPFSLIVFMINGQVDYTFGLIHAAGNVIGAYFASRYASHVGMQFIRWLLIILIATTILDLLNVISIKNLLLPILS